MKTIKMCVAIFSIFLTFSCKKFLDKKVISDVSYNYYGTQQGIESGVSAAYDALRYQYENESSIYFSN